LAQAAREQDANRGSALRRSGWTDRSAGENHDVAV